MQNVVAHLFGDGLPGVCRTLSGESLSGGAQIGALVRLRSGPASEHLARIEARRIDPLTGRLVHLTLRRIHSLEPVHARVAVRLDDIPAHGGVAILSESPVVTVEAGASTLAETLTLSVASLRADTPLCARDLVLPAGHRLLSDPNQVLATLDPLSAPALTLSLSGR
jgi:hypothetical protein